MDLPVNLLSFLLHYLYYYFGLFLHFNSACSVFTPKAKDFTIFWFVGVNPV